MAGPWYYRSAAAGTADGLSWANARVSLATMTSVVAGDTIYVSDDHNETTAAQVTITFPGTQASPNFIYCSDHTVATPGTGDLKTTGIVSTTGSGSNIIFAGSFYLYGLTFNAGDAANSAQIRVCSSANNNQVFEACALVLNNTNAASQVQFNSGGYLRLVNTTITNGATGQGVINGNSSAGRLVWRNTPSALLGTIPTNIFNNPSNLQALIEGVDLSAAGAGKTLVASNNQAYTFVFKDCKFGASVTIAATEVTLAGKVFVVRSDSSGTNYVEQVYDYAGTQTDETTIVRTGGATDGTTPKSRKIVTTANSKWVLPYESNPITIWNDSTSAITTLTIYGTTTGGGVPKDDEIWVDVVYPKDAGDPLGGFVTSTKANNLATSSAVNNSSDGSTWGGGGAGNGFKIVVPSFTPALKGPLTIYVKVAKASSTYYIDPKPSISGITVSKSYVVGGPMPVLVNELSSGGAAQMLYQNRMGGNVA